MLCELSNFVHVLDVVSHTRISVVNRNHDPHANSLANLSTRLPGPSSYNLTKN